MPFITSLEGQKNDPERVNVYVDGAFAFGVSLMVVLAHRLEPGRELPQEEIENLIRDDSVERFYAAALNFLSYRPRSRREVQDYLRRREVDADTVDAVVGRLERLGLVDDHAFAQYWVENRQTFRPRGSRALRMEMRQKGLESEVIDAALETRTDEEDAAYEAARRRTRSFASLEQGEAIRKLAQFLQRRGFTYETSLRVARDVVSGKRTDRDADV